MSQLDTPYGQQTYAEPARTSGLAIWALVCSVIFCCPVTTLLGVLLGIGAFVSIGGDPAKKGRGLAVAAIILGLVFTAAQAVVGYYLYDIGKKTFDLMMKTGPETVKQGFAGDYDGFRVNLYGPGASATDEEIKAYFDELSDRYGTFVDCRIDESGQTQPPFGQPVFDMMYILEFDDGQQQVLIELVMMDQATGKWVFKVRSLTVPDDDQGDLTFP